MEAEMKGYYVMLIGGKNIQNVGVDDYSGGYQIGSASYLLVLLPVLIVPNHGSLLVNGCADVSRQVLMPRS